MRTPCASRRPEVPPTIGLLNRPHSLATLLGLAASARALGAGPMRRILRLRTGNVDEVPLENYVAAVVPAEIGAHAPAAALEAQAVAARSYAVARAEHAQDD